MVRSKIKPAIQKRQKIKELQKDRRLGAPDTARRLDDQVVVPGMGVSLRDRAVGFAEAPANAGSSPFGLPSLTRPLRQPRRNRRRLRSRWCRRLRVGVTAGWP